MALTIRSIQSEDNPVIEMVIRDCLAEFNANRPGFAWQDPELSRLSFAYQAKGSAYFVAEKEGIVVGGAGIGALKGVDRTCELQKMYLLPSARGSTDEQGKSIADHIMKQCLDFAQTHYTRCYLETFTTMERAMRFYQKWGFSALDFPLGDTGHGGCDRWFVREL